MIYVFTFKDALRMSDIKINFKIKSLNISFFNIRPNYGGLGASPSSLLNVLPIHRPEQEASPLVGVRGGVHSVTESGWSEEQSNERACTHRKTQDWDICMFTVWSYCTDFFLLTQSWDFFTDFDRTN